MVATGCAPVLPSLAGGRVTPNGRVDVAGGAAVRVPVGDLVAQVTPDDVERSLAVAGPGGVAPLGVFRVGVARDLELGAVVAGSTAHVMLRGQLRLSPTVRLTLGLMPFAGGAGDERASALRLGGQVPAVLGISISGVYEAWFGLRAAGEYLGGEADSRELMLAGIRVGGVVGLAAGFRRLHVIAELGVDHEWWLGSFGDTSISRTGIALTPGFAVRLRF
ncbi:MAG: hypothetical protein AB7S26_00625 [Sandaracinaceae bacterium]